MKILKLSLYFFSFMMLIACEEEKHKPHFSGDTPSAVKEYSIENMPGAAVISFKLSDNRTSYVKAVYTLKGGLVREAKSSKYDNKLIVDGFSEAREYSVALYAVGKGEEESEPVHVTVNPGIPPYQAVVKDLDVKADWGGGKLTGLNPTSAQLLIGILKKNSITGVWEDVEVFFTESKSLDFNFRKQAPINTEFGIYSRDKWQNFSDTVSFTFEPWEEIQVPIDHQNAAHFQHKMPDDAPATSATYGIAKSFDGKRATFADGYYSANDGSLFPKFITIDLLATYQLSRFKYWQNGPALHYRSANAKHIRIWGNTTMDTDVSTWYLLGEWDDWRPSGRPPEADYTDEDLAVAQAGADFDFPIEARATRFIRIEAVTSWEPRTRVYYPELRFWGREVQ